MLKIDQISLLQKLELKPLESNYYRWGSSENCFSVQKSKLFSGMFCTDLSWLIVASILKQTAFDVRSINNHIVYEVTEYNPDRGQTDSSNHSYCLSFKVENEVLTPLVMQVDPTTKEEVSKGCELGILCPYDPTELRRSKRRNAQPDRYLGCDNLPDYEVEVTRLGESKTYMKEYDESSSEEEEEEEYDEYRRALSVQDDNEFQQHRSGENGSSSSKRKSKDGAGSDVDSDAPKCKNSKKSGMSKFERTLAALKAARLEELSIVPTDGSADKGLDKNFMNFKVPEENPKDIGEMVSKYFYMNGFQSTQKRKTLDFMDVESGGRKGLKATRRKYQRVSSHMNSLKRDCFYVRESIYDVRSFRKGSVTAQLCRELIRRCMNNIDATLKNEPVQPPVVEQWKEHQSKISSNEKEPDEKPTVNNDGGNNEEGISEIDMLWNEMEVALASWYLLDNNEVQLLNLHEF